MTTNETPKTNPKDNPALIAQSGYIDLLTACQNLVELSAVRTEYMTDKVLNDVQL